MLEGAIYPVVVSEDNRRDLRLRNGSIAGRYMQYTRQMCMRRSKKVVTVTPLEAKTGKFKSTNRSSQKGRQTKKSVRTAGIPRNFLLTTIVRSLS